MTEQKKESMFTNTITPETDNLSGIPSEEVTGSDKLMWLWRLLREHEHKTGQKYGEKDWKVLHAVLGAAPARKKDV